MRVIVVAILGIFAIGGCAASAQAERAEHVVVVTGEAGQVEFQIQVPNALSSGADSEIYRYGATNVFGRSLTAMVGVAADELPDGCSLESVEDWTAVESDTGWPSYPRLSLDQGEHVGGGVGRRAIDRQCEGTFDLVFKLAVLESGASEILRVPVMVES